MATGDAPTQTPAAGDEVETLAGEDTVRRGRMGLRVPSDAVPPPTAPDGLEPLPDVLGLIGEHTPPAMQAVDSAPEVNVEVGALTSVSLPPPPPYAAIPYPAAPPGNAAAMRVVRRKIRKLGGDDSEAADAASAASDEAPTAPKLPRITGDEPRPVNTGSPLVVAVSRPPQALGGRASAELVKPTPIPSPPVPRVEPIAAEDFAVPAVEEVEAQAADPPPPPLSLKRSAPPSGEAATPRELPRRPPSMPPTGFRASIPPPAPADEPGSSPAPEPTPTADEDGVELSIEEPRDEDVHRISSPDDILEATEAAAQARNVSMPPPPPPSVRAPGSSRATAVTVVEAKRRRRFWWEELFTDDYFRTVPHLDRDQVRADVDWIEHALGTESGASILDLACGAGLHATELALRRYDVTGVDLSAAMLARAAETATATGAQVTWSQTDMCQMEFDAAFDAAYCVGNSFGLFDDERNAEVARRLHRALKPHGTFLLQVLNRDHAIQRQPAMAWFEGDACVCMEESSFNFITSRLNVKRTMIFDDGRQREIEYSVRLYSLHEIGQVLHQAGFRILEVSGHPRTPGAFFGASSRELIILAQKRGAEVVEIPQADATQRAPMIDV